MLKISLDVEGYSLMMQTINDLNKDSILPVHTNDFLRLSFRFVSEIINENNIEHTKSILKTIKNKDKLSGCVGGPKKNNMLAIQINTDLLNLINKAIDNIKSNNILEGLTLSVYTRICILYFSKHILNKQLGIAFISRKTK